ncbi:phosphorelay signal transduction system [Ascochyta rabiei]|uniref:Phosphorelay signal transduction system n=1 Tax=Didymella rabiei TaxID=5454 RepID=A0A163EDU2_DIDRA|nr:phosphorelay signal transduction system [Ascochyta rabiei]
MDMDVDVDLDVDVDVDVDMDMDMDMDDNNNQHVSLTTAFEAHFPQLHARGHGFFAGMSSVKSRRFLPRFLRRSSATSTATRSNASGGNDASPRTPSTLRKSLSLSKLAAHSATELRGEALHADAERDPRLARSEPSHHTNTNTNTTTNTNTATNTATATTTITTATTTATSSSSPSPARTRTSTTASTDAALPTACPQVTLEAPTPIHPPPVAAAVVTLEAPTPTHPPPVAAAAPVADDASALSASASTAAPPPASPLRRQSLVAPPPPADHAAAAQPALPALSALSAAMLHRKIWVKRPNASATLVQIGEDDLVDDVRDMILRKYANSLGRSFDSPDVTLGIVPRDAGPGHERTLGPEEHMCRTLDAYFPGGQSVAEALIIDVPVRRTPKPSPRVPLYYAHHDDAQHAQTEYFPPMPAVQPSPAAAAYGPPQPPHSIAVLTNGGQLPPLPSPGAAAARRTHLARPNSLARTQHDTPPTLRVASPRPEKKRRRKPAPAETPSLPAGLLDGSVPPINVLIVEDNIINLRVLGAFMQRLKVRWERAMNGREAVTKWKAGGFHLVLMDIQLPVMNGLEATKEIRRLERVNSIGVFSSGSSETPHNGLDKQGASHTELAEDDKLGDRSLFKSPVIIVALTASSLQSDRHEALAAGCNDFLTKPVNFVWLERKVKEWGCMQALIDFDGWRKWKDFAKDSDSTNNKDTSKMSTSMATIAPTKKSTNAKSAAPAPAANTPETNGSSSAEKEDKKGKRRSLVQAPPTLPEDESETPTPDADDT